MTIFMDKYSSTSRLVDLSDFLSVVLSLLQLICIWPVYACKKKYTIKLQRYSEIFIVLGWKSFWTLQIKRTLKSLLL